MAGAALWLGAGRVYVSLLDDRIGIDPEAPELMLTTPDRVLSLPPPGSVEAGAGPNGLTASEVVRAAREQLSSLVYG